MLQKNRDECIDIKAKRKDRPARRIQKETRTGRQMDSDKRRKKMTNMSFYEALKRMIKKETH